LRPYPKIFMPALVVAVILLSIAGSEPATGRVHSAASGDSEPDFTRALRTLTGIAPFDETLALLREHYVEKMPDKEIFEAILNKFTMCMLPHCTEDLESFTLCRDDPETCFVKAVSTAASACKIDLNAALLRALNLYLQDLDPNSCLMDSGMLKELKIGTSGKFGGVGMVVTPKGGDYVVISPFEGSPAYKAGIKAGDMILEIDGQPLHGLPLLEVLRKVRGPSGSIMSAKVRQAKTGSMREFKIRRRIIQIPPVRFAMISPDVAYLRIVNFQETVSADVQQALFQFSRIRAVEKALILDLRDNPGGIFDEAIQVAGLFFSSGPITSLRGRNPSLNREFTAPGQKGLPGTRIIVLINQGSASASEILAGALQGKPNVVVMGRHSFGKASVQAIFPIHKGMALRLTTAHYFTPDGRNIDGKGLQPDVILEEDSVRPERTRVDVLRADQLEDDPWIRKVLEYVAAGDKSGSSPFSTLY
jgi:carboxyl-terminal processing protease